MLFFLSKYWLWLLLAALLAALIAWFICRRKCRQFIGGGISADSEHELNQARSLIGQHNARIDELQRAESDHAREIVELRAKLAEAEGASHEAASLRSRVAELEVGSADASGLHARISDLQGQLSAQADEHALRVADLEGQLSAGLGGGAAGLIGGGAAAGLIGGQADVDVDGLNSRIAELEGKLSSEVGSRDALIADLEGQLNSQLASRDTRIGDLQGQLSTELSSRDARIAELEAELAARPALGSIDAGASLGSSAPVAAGLIGGGAAAAVTSTTGAAEVLGFRLKADDLTAVEGIGPKIRDLLHADGITTWLGLSQAEVERLQRVLTEAGPRFQMHNPGTWPQQAGLLARGEWDAFKELTDRLKGGRALD